MTKPLLPRRFAAKNRINKKTVSQKIRESKKVTAAFIVVLFFVVGLLYIFQINGVATKGYDIREYEKRLEDLKRENQKMMIVAAELKSMQILEKKAGELSYVDSKDIAYITSTSEVMAMKK